MTSPKKSLAVVSAVLLSACASTLLWTQHYQDDPRSFASTLAVDASGATYVGGGVLEAPADAGEEAWWQYPGAVLSKYDTNGQRLWVHKLESAQTIKSVHVLNANRILVHGSAVMPDESGAAGSLLIASSETGELIRVVDEFSPEYAFSDIVVDANRIYVATEHAVTVFDHQGEQLDSEAIEPAVRDMDVADTGEVFLAVEFDQPSRAYQKRTATLDLLWESATKNYPVSPFALTALAGGEVAVLSDSTLTKYDGQGNVVFTNDLEDISVSRDTFWSLPFIYGSAFIKADAAGSLYLAVSMTDLYALGEGAYGVWAGNIATSTTLAKFDGNNGQLVWQDNLRTVPITHPIDTSTQTQRFSNTSYWPISLDVTASGIKMVVSAFRGDYAGDAYNGRPANCVWNPEAEFYPIFTCPLVHFTEAYSKSYTYDAATGKRLKKGEKIAGHVRDIAYSASGQLHLVGDNAIEMDPFHNFPLGMSWLTWEEFGDNPLQKFLPGGAVHTPQSQLFVSKYK